LASASDVAATHQTQEPTAIAPVTDRELAVRQAQRLPRSTKYERLVTPASSAEKPEPAAKGSLRRTSSPVRTRGAQRSPGKMERLHLGWLRSLVKVRTEPL